MEKKRNQRSSYNKWNFFFFENQEKELFLVDNTNSKRQLRKEQIVDCGEETDRFRRSSYKTKIWKCNQSIMSVNAEIKPLVVSEGPPSHVPVSKEGLPNLHMWSITSSSHLFTDFILPTDQIMLHLIFKIGLDSSVPFKKWEKKI